MPGSKFNIPPTFKNTLAVIALLYPTLSAAFSFNALDLNDLVDINPGDGVCQTTNGTCSLRAAIQETNAWPGHDSINLASGTYQLSLTGSDNNANTGDLDITESLSLTGEGSGQTVIDAGGIDRIVQTFTGNTTVILEGLSLINGNTGATGGGAVNNGATMIIRNSILSNNSYGGGNGGGGAIYNSGDLTLEHVEITNNQSTASTGGAIFNSTGSILTANHSTVSGNSAKNSGGGILNNGTLSLADSTIDNNSSAATPGGANGGGLYNAGSASLDRCLVSNNLALFGAGLWNGGNGTITLNDTTISNNQTHELWFDNTPAQTGSGGGLYVDSGTAQLNRLTIASNRANFYGGGIFVATGASGSIGNTLLSDNTEGFTATPPTVGNCTLETGAALNSADNNLVNDNDTSCGLATTIDTPNDNQTRSFTLPALAAQGGASQTHAIPISSMADNGGNCASGTTDQRGVTRATPACDIGAYELTASDPTWSDLGIQLSYFPQPVIAGDTASIRIKAENTGPAASATTTITISDLILAGLNSGLNYNSDDSATSGTSYNNTNGAWSAGTLTTGQSKTLTLVTTAEAALSTTIAYKASTSTDLNPANNNSSFTLDISADIGTRTDLNLTSTTQVDGNPVTEVIADTPFSYDFTILNNGSATTRNILLTVTLPADIDVLSTNGCSLSSNILTCSIDSLPSGATSTQTISARPTIKSGALPTMAKINFTGIDTNSSDNTISTAPTVTPKTVDLGVAITPSAAQIVEGNTISYGIIITNYGVHDASGVELTLNLPADTIATLDSIISEKDFQARPLISCDPSGLIRTCTLNESLTILKPNDSVSLTVFMVSSETPDNADTLIDFSASVSSTLADDPDTGNDNVTVQIPATDATGTVSPISDLSIELTVGPDQIYVTDPITLTAIVTNNGNNLGIESQALGTTLTFTVPTAMTVDLDSLPINCSISGNQITCGWPDVIWANGAVSSRILVSTTTADSYRFSATTINSTDPDLSSNSMEVTAVVDPEPGFRPRAGSGCFIATAAYGSYLDQHVMALRQFRDNILIPSDIGRWLVDIYYQTSPPLADYISQHENLRALTRVALTPLIYIIEYPIPGTTLLLLGAGGLLLLRRRFEQTI